MKLTFNMLLKAAGLPPAEVRLLRHKDTRPNTRRAPYELWRDSPPEFEFYQATQTNRNRSKLDARYWASFVGTPADETLFVGAYCVRQRKELTEDVPRPQAPGEVDPAGSCDWYDLQPLSEFADFAGKLLVEWGPGKKAWIQHADRQDKPIIELRPRFTDPLFPGFLKFKEQLSRLEALPESWKEVLRHAKGVYVLTCPRTKEQYVGSAGGAEGFWQRWMEYVKTGHGGNVALKSREPSDYRVAILEVVGTAASETDLLQAETLWMDKLQSTEMGLNRRAGTPRQPSGDS